MSIKCRKQCCLFDVFRKNDILKMALTVVFLFLFSHTGAQESQLKGPENTLSVVDSNVTLKCLSPSGNCNGTEWLKFAAGNPMTIFNRYGIIANAYRDRYSVDNNSSGCGLVIKNVQLTDAGRFICRAFMSSNTVEKSAYLIILKTQPKCRTNASEDNTVEGDGVQLVCEVIYNGTNRASMVWKDITNGKTIGRSDSVVASAPEVPSFTCETSFAFETKNENGAPITDLATNNIPVATCMTTAIKVLYSVRNVSLSPSFYNYPPGTVITCSAKGNPLPTFKWEETENSGTWTDIQNQNGSTFTMTNVSSKRYRCFAMNVVRGKSNNATSVEIQFNNTGSDDNGSVTDASTTVNTTPLYLNLTVQIGVGAGVGVILLIVLLIICFLAPCCPGYKCRHSSENAKIIREEQPLTENPDIYSNINDAQLNAPKAKPRSAEPPKLPQNAPPQAKPRTDNKKAVPANAYHHEEVTYAELAREDGPHQVIPKNNDVPQETLYAAVGTA